MKSQATSCLGVLALISAATARLPAASNPGPAPGSSQDPPAQHSEVHFLQLEISWDFGDVQPPDWRKELVEDDPTARFRLRWKHFGPSFDGAKLAVYDTSDTLLGELPLSLDPPAGDGWRYTSFLVGDLPGPPTVTMRVRLVNAQGHQTGSASPEAQITVPSPEDPFLYTPLFIYGIVTDTGIPGIAGGVNCGSRAFFRERRFHAGVRKFDGGAGPVGSNDRWHWGSNTKAMTCTAIAILIQNGTVLPGGGGTLVWDTRISAVFPEWGGILHPRFINTTLRHLACHRSGIYLNDTEWALANTPEGSGDPVQLRRDIAMSAFSRDHTHPDTGLVTPVGVDFDYRNENYFLLGAVIEKMTGLRYENAMQALLFGPLGMTTVGWGVPPEFSYYQPHGHRRSMDYPYEVFVDDIELFPPQAPAGALYCSVEDMLKFLRLHLHGSEGTVSLSAAMRSELHTPYPLAFSGDAGYAMGWGTKDGITLGHDGSIGRYYARMNIWKSENILAASVTNIGGYPADENFEPIGSPKSYGNDAVNLLQTHLYEKGRAECIDQPWPGTFFAESAGNDSIQAWTRPLPEWVQDDWNAPRLDVLEDGFIPVSLYLSDVVAQRKQAAARAPRILSFRPSRFPTYRLEFTSEAGATYQLWELPGLQRSARNLLQSRQAFGETTVFHISVLGDGQPPMNFFQVGDLMP